MSLLSHLSDRLEDDQFTTAPIDVRGGPRPDAAVVGSSAPRVKTGKRSTEESPELPMKSSKRRRRLVLQITPPTSPTGSRVGPAGVEAGGLGAGMETEEVGSQSSLSDTASLDQEYARRPFCLDGNLTNGTLLNTPEACHEFMYHVLPPGEQLSNRRMSDQELSDHFCTTQASIFSTASEFHRRWVSMARFQEKARREITNLKETLSQATLSKLGLLQQVSVLQQQLYGSNAKAARAEQKLERVRADLARSELEREKAEKEKQDQVNKMNTVVSNLQRVVNDNEKCIKDIQAKVLKLQDAEKYTHTQLSVKEDVWKIEREGLEKIATLAVVRAEKLEADNAQLKEDCHWLISEGFRMIFNKVMASQEFDVRARSVGKAFGRYGYVKGLMRAGYQGTGLNDLWSDLNSAAAALKSVDYSLIKKVSESADLSLEELKAVIGSTRS